MGTERLRELFDRVPLRMLAPASLALFALVLLVVVVASLGGDGSSPSSDSSSGDNGTTSERTTTTRTTNQPKPDGAAAGRRVYVVKPGDSLVQIAQQTQVPIERLIALNPSVDPQALVTGQRIKLRE